jgi:hypothetical protein
MMRGNVKVSLVVLVALFCTVILANTTFAGPERCQVKIILLGTTDTSGPVLLAEKLGGSCPGWDNPTVRLQNNFTVNDPDRMLATMLTAQALEQSLYIHSLTDSFNNWATIHQVYLGP